MDITFVKIIEIAISEDEETGEMETRRVYLPTLMKKKDIEDVHPGLAMNGRLFKNVSTIKTYTGHNYNVVGNYKEINKLLESNEIRNPVGYGSRTKEN